MSPARHVGNPSARHPVPVAGASGLGLASAVELVTVELVRRGALSVESEPRVVGLLERFGRFASSAFGVDRLSDVTREHVEAFVRSRSAASAGAPSVATMRLRRSALRLLFRTARELGLMVGDPTVDLVLPSRTDRSARPLTDVEVESCRRAALNDLAGSRLAVAWALGEATARTSEIPKIAPRDLDLDGQRVWIAGSHNTEARWATLTDWGSTQLRRAIGALGQAANGATRLAYAGSGNVETRRTLSCQAIRETFQRAGLTEDSSVRPASLAAWAGRQVLEETGRIEAVAQALGVRSLDGAARLIGWEWTKPLEGPRR